ncbi:MAG TPA: hypothetical protein VMT19_08855 [Thermoanaerobaculaceae bacterium]|nr:hypothetical protein [Thermoanaerobaculaceae bacterium]
MSQRTVGWMMLTAGVLIFIVSAAADQLGIGGAPGLGWKQISGIVLGVVIAGAGLTKMRGAGG